MKENQEQNLDHFRSHHVVKTDHLLISKSPDPILLLQQGRIVEANDAAIRLFQETGNGFPIGKEIAGFISEDLTQPQFIACQEGSCRFQAKVFSPGEKEIAGELTLLSAASADPETFYLQMRPLNRQDSLVPFQLVLENASEGVVITDAHCKVVWVNQAFTKVTGYEPEEIIGRNPSLLKSGKHSKDFYNQLWRSLLSQGKWQGEIWNRKKNGEIYAEKLSIFVIKNETQEISHYGGIFSDITRHKEEEERISYLAFRDSLTGLYNRAMFSDRLNLELVKAKRKNQMLALLFIDLDNFKTVNDRFGHGIGDSLLKILANRLVSVIRKSDTVARVGGDEFLIILPDIRRKEDVDVIARKIVEIFQEPWKLTNAEFHVTASIGIAVFPEDGLKPSDLIERADFAMYRAKEKGQNQYAFYSGMEMEPV